MPCQCMTDDERGEGVKSSKDLVGELSSNLSTVAKIPDIKSHEVETSTVQSEAIAIENQEAVTVEKVHFDERKAEIVKAEKLRPTEDLESKMKTLDPSSEGKGDVKIETKQITENLILTETGGAAEVTATIEEIDSVKEQTMPESVILKESSSHVTQSIEELQQTGSNVPEAVEPLKQSAQEMSKVPEPLQENSKKLTVEKESEAVEPVEKTNKEVAKITESLQQTDKEVPKDIESVQQANQASQYANETNQEISLALEPVNQDSQEVLKIENIEKVDSKFSFPQVFQVGCTLL